MHSDPTLHGLVINGLNAGARLGHGGFTPQRLLAYCDHAGI